MTDKTFVATASILIDGEEVSQASREVGTMPTAHLIGRAVLAAYTDMDQDIDLDNPDLTVLLAFT